MKKQLLFALAVCLQTWQLLWAQQTLSGTITHDGLVREYSYYVPAIYNGNNAVPLLFNLHGYTSNNLQQQFYGDFRGIADTANFIIVHPNGTLDPSGQRYWNVGFFDSNVDDIGFLEALADTLSQQYNIDQQRIYSTGMSNGGFMSYLLACSSPRFAAVASVTGSMTLPMYLNCQPTRPVPAMEVHGTADPTVPYVGSALMQATEDVVAYWVQHNNCNPTPTITDVPNTNPTDGATAQHYVYTGGDGGATVEFFKVQNGAHTWPGASIVLGVTCMDFSASREVWRFLSQYQLSDFSTAATQVVQQQCRVSPNPATDCLHIQLPPSLANTATLEFSQLHVYNAMGVKVWSQPINWHSTDQQTVCLGSLPSGVYYLQIDDANVFFNKKIIKQ